MGRVVLVCLVVCASLVEPLVAAPFGLHPASLHEGDAYVATQRVSADLIIPGNQDPISKGVLLSFASNGTIAYVGDEANAPTDLLRNITASWKVNVLMPGMFDVHTHFGGQSCTKLNPDSAFMDGYSPKIFEDFGCALLEMKETLCAGVTSVRELGGIYGQALSHVSNLGLHPGPHFHFAGQAIGMTGGHTDEQYVPLDIVRKDYGVRYSAFGALCDGASSCVQKVREQLRKQADVIKIMTSGGVLSAFDSPTDQELSLDELVPMVAEATRARRAVAAHAHGAPGILTAIQSGITTIEHGSYMIESLATQASELHMVHVPTITICQTFNRTQRPPEYDELQWAKGVEVLTHNSQAVRNAIAANLTIATGTDCPGNCAQVAKEGWYLVNYFGLTTREAVQALTANGPLTLMVRGKNLGMAPLTGQLRQGYIADMIALSEDPLEDISALQDTDKITHIWKQGEIFKSPQMDPCVGVKTNTVPLSEWVPKMD